MGSVCSLKLTFADRTVTLGFFSRRREQLENGIVIGTAFSAVIFAPVHLPPHTPHICTCFYGETAGETAMKRRRADMQETQQHRVGVGAGVGGGKDMPKLKRKQRTCISWCTRHPPTEPRRCADFYRDSLDFEVFRCTIIDE